MTAVGVRTPRDFVYMGKRLDDKHQYFLVVGVLDENGNILKECMYKYDKKSDRTIGGIFKGASFTENYAIQGQQAASYVKKWSDLDEVISWEVADQNAERSMRSHKLEKENGRISEIEKLMTPLRKQYESCVGRYDRPGREALERAVLTALRTPLRGIEKEK